eukprot:1183640-Prorocentrum_minimum.AAC.3
MVYACRQSSEVARRQRPTSKTQTSKRFVANYPTSILTNYHIGKVQGSSSDPTGQGATSASIHSDDLGPLLVTNTLVKACLASSFHIAPHRTPLWATHFNPWCSGPAGTLQLERLTGELASAKASVAPPGGVVSVTPPGGVVSVTPPGGVVSVTPPGGVVSVAPPGGVVSVTPPGGVASVTPPGGAVSAQGTGSEGAPAEGAPAAPAVQTISAA